jgi:hypothetical protein
MEPLPQTPVMMAAVGGFQKRIDHRLRNRSARILMIGREAAVRVCAKSCGATAWPMDVIDRRCAADRSQCPQRARHSLRDG